MHDDPQKYQNSLAPEVWRLFLQAKNARTLFNPALRKYAAKATAEQVESEQSWAEFEKKAGECNLDVPEPDCGCGDSESCDVCEAPDQDVCTIKDSVDLCKKRNVFDGLTALLTLVKSADYTAAVENYYAPVGNKPMELKAPDVTEASDSELEEAADTFFSSIQQFLDANQVKITELPQAFNFDAMTDMVDQLEGLALDQLREETQDGLNHAEDVLESLFGEIRLMIEYMKVLRDPEDSPIGVLWCHHNAPVYTLKANKSSVKKTRQMRPTAERIDPCYFWATPDWTEDIEGRALFRMISKTSGDLEQLKSIAPEKLRSNINELLEHEGHRMYSAHLFVDDMDMQNGKYDVLICRGSFHRDMLKASGVDIKSDETMIAAEVWYAKGMVINAEQLPDYAERMGVYTTYFRNQGNSIWGISLHDFIEPFARLYEGTIKRIDTSVAKSVGSIVMADTGVMPDFEKHLKQDAEGNYMIDFTSDMVFEFDSTEAGMSPNFKGVPIHVTRLPHDLDKLFPVLNTIFQQIEIITGIPSILSTGNPDSSAVRTDDSYKTAFRAANAKIASIIRRSRDNVLMPATRFFYHSLINDGLLKGFPIEAYPEILFDKRLELEISNARNMAGVLTDFGPYAQMLPQEKVAGLLNKIARDAYGFEDDLIEGVNPVGGATPQVAAAA